MMGAGGILELAQSLSMCYRVLVKKKPTLEVSAGLAILIVIAIVALILQEGSATPSNTASTSTPMAVVSAENAGTNSAPSQAAQPTDLTQNTSSDLAQSGKNGLLCKSIAMQATKLDQSQYEGNGETTTLLATNYYSGSQSCYYEVYINDPNFTETDIRVAPDDAWIAWCANSSSIWHSLQCQVQQYSLTTDLFPPKNFKACCKLMCLPHKDWLACTPSGCWAIGFFGFEKPCL